MLGLGGRDKRAASITFVIECCPDIQGGVGSKLLTKLLTGHGRISTARICRPGQARHRTGY